MKNSDWFNRVKQLDLPAVVPVSELPNSQAPLQDWMKTIREDPLLTIHLFRYANKMLASHDVSVRTLDHAVSLLGSTRLGILSGKIQRLSNESASTKGLLRAIGDSLLAASLMRQWFSLRQIPWTEADYWVTLFYDLGIWVLWLLEPEKMESIDLRAKQGENRDKLLQDLIDEPLRQWNERLCSYYQLPVIPEESNSEPQNERIESFKQSALKFFLPFSHELAFNVRQDWQSENLAALCRTGEISLGLTEFRPLLKQWVTIGAREFQFPHAAIAARRLLAQQPSVIKSTTKSGFNGDDLAFANHFSQTTSEVENSQPPESGWPEAEKHSAKNTLARQTTRLATTHTEKTTLPRSQQINLNIQREIRRQFRNQKSWHSALEIQESALYGLQKGLCLSRIVVLEEVNGFWQAFNSEGCQSSLLLRNLKLAIHSSEILMELSKRVTALWVNSGNRLNAEKKLPPSLIEATNEANFFLRSFSIKNKITMLLYVDAYGFDEELEASDYQLFREYCADWNTALNKMSQ